MKNKKSVNLQQKKGKKTGAEEQKVCVKKKNHMNLTTQTVLKVALIQMGKVMKRVLLD